MDEKLKIQQHFSRLRAEIGYSIENLPALNKELTARLSTFETITAPEKDIFPGQSSYWIAKTIIVIDFIEESFPDKSRYGEKFLASCGYDQDETERIKLVRDGKFGRRVLGHTYK